MTDWALEEQRAEENARFENEFAKSESKLDDAAAATERMERTMLSMPENHGDIGDFADGISVIGGMLFGVGVLIFTKNVVVAVIATAAMMALIRGLYALTGR